MSNTINFGNRLKELRKEKGLSQSELAKLMEVHFTQVSRYERGETKPNIEAITKLAKALDTSVDYLIGGATAPIAVEPGVKLELLSRIKEVPDLRMEENVMLIQLTNQKAAGLLYELEALQVIKILKENIAVEKPRLSDKYKGVISKEEGQKLQEHIQQMRSEWNNT